LWRGRKSTKKTRLFYMISYTSADIVFGYTHCHPGGVLDRHLEAYTKSWDEARRQELRLLMTTTRVFVRYRSRTVETVVRMLCSRFLERIYKHRFEADCKELSFLLTLVWHYRAVEYEQGEAIFDRNADFYKRYGRVLFEKGVIEHYQESLF